MTANLKTENDDASFDWKGDRIKALFKFLERNVEWNEAFQEREYARSLASCTSSRDRLVGFLHLNVSTQSGADMDELQPFWEALHAATDDQISTLTNFTQYLVQKVTKEKKSLGTRDTPDGVWEALFVALNSHFGWGIKTTALFVKATIKLHRGPKALHFWPDATREAAPVMDSRLFLPVDRVITRIFEELGLPSPGVSSINNGLRDVYRGEAMLIWDDLWFWGFFTQKKVTVPASTNRVKGTKRILVWNPAKFWSQLSSDKDRESELEVLGEEFLTLLKR